MSSNNVSPAVPTSPITAATEVQATGTPVVTVPTGTPPTALPEVITLLKAAGDQQKTVYDSIRKAAALAAAAMSPNLSPGEKVKQVQAIYAGVLAEINDNNVRATFSSFLWIHAAPQAKVEIPAIPKAGETKVTQIVDAAAALNVSKAVMHDVAKQVRDIHDAGRASGGGRKATVTVTAPSVAAAAAAVSGSDAAPNFFEQLELRMNDAGDFARIVAAIEKRGYSVTRKASIAPAAAAGTSSDATAALAAALAETVPATALAQAAVKATAKAKGGTAK